MRKFTTTLFIFLCALTAGAQSNSKGSSNFANRFSLEVATVGSSTSKDMNQIGFKANIGYDIIPQLFVFAQIEGEKYLYKSGDVKTHFSSNTLGGGLGTILFDTKDDKGSMGTIDARFAVGTTVGNPELKATTYDLSINWKILRGISPTLGLGYRHINTRTSGMPKMNVVYGTLGIKF